MIDLKYNDTILLKKKENIVLYFETKIRNILALVKPLYGTPEKYSSTLNVFRLLNWS